MTEVASALPVLKFLVLFASKVGFEANLMSS